MILPQLQIIYLSLYFWKNKGQREDGCVREVRHYTAGAAVSDVTCESVRVG